MIQDWEQNRCIGCRVKVIAITSMLAVGGLSVFYALESSMSKILGGLFIGVGLITVSLIRTCGQKDEGSAG